MPPRRIVLTTLGSLGDLHPFLAVGRALAARGHQVTVATLPGFEARVAEAGLAYAPVRATVTDKPSAELMRRVFNGRKGVEFILRELVMPALRTAYEDTLAAAEGADLLVVHPLTLAGSVVAERLGMPWVSVQLAPLGMLSVTDPPVLPGLRFFRSAPSAVWRAVFALAEQQTRRWVAPVAALRRELGLPAAANPLFAGAHSPVRELALFSPLFGPPQPDWPASTVATGFAFYDQPTTPDPAMERWLAEGAAPVIFTLGSSAVMDPGAFFAESAAAAEAIGVRALLVGADPAQFAGRPDVLAVPYAPYAPVFPHGAAVVHQGGAGTTAETLRAGRPMLVVPFGVDQPDNADRARRLGVGRVIWRREQYRQARVARELEALLRPAYAEAAMRVGAAIRAERGAETAAAAIEAVLG